MNLESLLLHFRKRLAKCADPVAYRIARHAILVTCANHHVVICIPAVIPVCPVVARFVVVIVAFILVTALTANYLFKS